jgi:hypothetical protein
MSALIACDDHGESAWCYVDSAGTHLDSEECICFSRPLAFCPVLEHRDLAEAAYRAEAQMRALERRLGPR